MSKAMAVPVTQRAPRVRAPRHRRHLEVVKPVRRGRRARLRLTVLLLSSFLTASLFGVVAFHVLLNQGQDGLDRLQSRVAAEQVREQRLRLEVAALQSPVRIVDVARERLGMVPPAAIAFVTPGISGGPVAAPVVVPRPAPAPAPFGFGPTVAAAVAPTPKPAPAPPAPVRP